MSIIGTLGTCITRAAGKSFLFMANHSPEILMGLGTAGFVGTCYLTGKAALKASEYKKNAEEDVDMCNTTKKVTPEYSEKEYQQDLKTIKAVKHRNMIVTYAPVAALGAASLMCMFGSHHILRKRNIALVAAYATLDSGFKAYRKRVIEEFSEEADWRFAGGVKPETVEITEVDDNGKEKKKLQLVDNVPEEPAGYTYIYDNEHTLINIGKDLSYIRDSLRIAQESANTILNARGYIFLNEIFRSIGMPEVPEGQIVGWELKGNGDGFVDFNIRPVFTKKEPCFILEFNVDGPIYKNISKYTRRW